MPKRVQSESEEEHEDASSLGSEDEPSTSKRKKSSTKAKGQPKSKKNKTEQHETTTTPAVGTIHTNSEGDKYIELSKKRRAVVRSFKGTALLDIREYYGVEGDEKPGKKGIALQLDQWQNLRDASSLIDGLFETLKK